MQNASVFRKKTGAVRKVCKDVEFGESFFVGSTLGERN
jgi:hypothetical protein